MYKILVIEDDVMMSEMLSLYLSEEGFTVSQASTGDEGLNLAKELAPDVILLDLMLPDLNGVEVCAQVREQSNVPIIILSSKSEVSERVYALKAGADDYLCKPFSMHELTARVEALIRRSSMNEDAAQQVSAAREVADTEHSIELDMDRRLLLVRGQFVETTYSEFELMKLFLANPGMVFSREKLIHAIRGFDSFVTDRAIDVHIVNLRKKIEHNPKEPKLLRTVWGFGYKYLPEQAVSR